MNIMKNMKLRHSLRHGVETHGDQLLLEHMAAVECGSPEFEPGTPLDGLEATQKTLHVEHGVRAHEGWRLTTWADLDPD